MAAYGMVIDTEEHKAVVRRLTDALYDWLTLDVREMERAGAAGIPPKPTPEMLIEAQERVERTRGRIEEARFGLKGLPGSFASVFEPVIVGPLEDQLRHEEEWLSKLQSEMEKADV